MTMPICAPYVRRLLGPNCEVQTVADGQAAIEAIRERAPDLVIADVMMPRLDGLALVQAIPAIPRLLICQSFFSLGSRRRGGES